MPRPNRVNEKSKDFMGSMKRLLKELKKWHFLMSLSLLLALISAIIALITPDRLSDLTNVITDGIKPNTIVLQTLSKDIQDSLSEEKLKEKLTNILTDESISSEDKIKLTNALSSMSNPDNKNIQNLLSLDENLVTRLFDDITIESTTITKEDQYQFMKIMSLESNSNEEDLLKKFDTLPKNIYNLVSPSINMDKVKKISLLLGILYLISSIFNYIESYTMTTISNNFAKNLRNRISNKINKLPLRYFDSHETGDILSRVTNDVDTVSQNMNNSLATLVSSITLFLGSIIMMFVTNWIMAVTAILASLIGFIFMGLLLGKSQKYFTKRQEELGNMNGYIEEIYSGHNVVKAYNGDKLSRNEFNKLNTNLYTYNQKSAFLSGLMPPIMGFVGNLGYVAVCVVGALLAMNNVISFGVIIAFMIYVRLFTNPLSQIAQAMTNLQSTAASAERVFEFFDEKEMPNEKDCTKYLDKSKVKGYIEFENVKFGYDDSRIIINDFSAKAKPGEKIAIVGPTGAGKTTMVNLLMKFYNINSGDIKIDGVSIKDLTRENIHDLFVMVLQDTWLFEGSVRDNIKYNKDDVTDEEIWKALEVVGANHFVKTLPNGLDATLNDSDSISQGQKQLLTIARGMIKNSPFLILDEATSNVDTRTEELVQKAMDKLTEGRTSFIIAHRLSTIKNADLILVMKDGNIIEQGNHNELMKKNGFYADLYNSQFSNND